MKKMIIEILSAVLLACPAAFERDDSSWVQYDIEGLFSISVPPTLELRDGDSSIGKLFDETRKSMRLFMGEKEMGKTIVFWPGMGSDRYARVMLNIIPQYGSSQSDMADVSASDVKELDEVWKQQRTSQVDIKSWYGSWREIHGGKYMFHLS